MEQKVKVNAEDVKDTNFAWAKIVKLDGKFYIVVGNLRSEEFESEEDAQNYCLGYPEKVIEMAIGYLLLKVGDWKNENE